MFWQHDHPYWGTDRWRSKKRQSNFLRRKSHRDWLGSCRNAESRGSAKTETSYWHLANHLADRTSSGCLQVWYCCEAAKERRHSWHKLCCCQLPAKLEDPRALWHPLYDHFYHTNALQRPRCQGDLRHRTVRQIHNLTRGMKTTTIIVASHGFCVPSVFVEIEFTACDDDPGHSKRSWFCRWHRFIRTGDKGHS